MEKKKRIYLTIVVVITLAILSGVTYLLIQRKNTVNQIEKIVENCAKNKIDNKFISNIDGEKIYYSIQNNWTEEGGINLKKVESYTEKKNWSKKCHRPWHNYISPYGWRWLGIENKKMLHIHTSIYLDAGRWI